MNEWHLVHVGNLQIGNHERGNRGWGTLFIFNHLAITKIAPYAIPTAEKLDDADDEIEAGYRALGLSGGHPLAWARLD